MSIRKNNKKAFSLIEISIVIVIIGILIAGITQGSRLLKASKISSAQSLTKGSPIASIPGLMVWFETSGGLNVEALTSATNGVEPEDGDAITKWIDINPQLTLKKELAPAATANRPTYVRDGINALPSLRFDGSSDVLFTTVAPISTGDDTYTIVAVFTPDSTIAANSTVLGQNPAVIATPANSSAILRVNATNVAFEGSAVADSTNTNSVATTTAANYALAKPQIVLIRVDNGASAPLDTAQIYINSNTAILSANKATTGTKTALNVSNATFAIGATYFAAGSSGYFNGLVSEVAVFDRALKRDEIESINKYLAQKYSISLN